MSKLALKPLLSDLYFIMFNRNPRQPSLRRVISRQCKCSRRDVKIQDEHIDYVTDHQMDIFMDLDQSDKIPWKPNIPDCDDISRIFWNNAKIWLHKEYGINAAVGWLWRVATPNQKAHSLNFYIRNPDSKFIFLYRDERIPLTARTTLAII